MNNRKSTKRALLTSVMALAMCVVMLIGTTFAWFTDTATANVNKIQSGKLDVALEMFDTTQHKWVNAEGETLNWVRPANATGDILWEPGCTYELPQLRVVNDGNLALKCKVQITGIKGSAKLNEAIEWTIDNDIALGTEMSLGVGAEKVFTIKGHMKDSAGNEYQNLSIEDISITVYATQDTVEYDSNNKTYDTDATYLNTDAEGNVLISNADELVYFAKTVNVDRENYAGKTVKLTKDINLAGKAWKPIGNVKDYPGVTFAGTFDGQGHTISNMVANDTTVKFAAAGFFGSITGKVQNLTIDNATVTSTHYAGGIVGYSSTNNGMVISDCKVTNSTITSSAERLTDGEYDNGDKVGGIIGYCVYGDTVTGCTVENCTIKGYRDIGGIVGCAIGKVDGNTSVTVNITNCTVTNNTIVIDDTHNYNGYTTKAQFNANPIVGRSDELTNTTGSTAASCATSETIADGFYKCVTETGDYWYEIGSAAGLENMNKWCMAQKGSTEKEATITGKTFKLTADIDFAGREWMALNGTGNAGALYGGCVFDGQGHTIRNLEVTGEGMFYMFSTNAGQDVTFKNTAFVNCKAVADGHFHVGLLVGSIYSSSTGKITFDGISIDGSEIKGWCNVGAIVGSTAPENSDVQLVFKNCDVKNTKVTATGEDGADPTGAAAFLGRALDLGAYKTTIVFEGSNSVEGNTIKAENGLVGGSVYNKTAWRTGASGFSDTEAVNDFTNKN